MSNLRTIFDPGTVFFTYAGVFVALAALFYLLERTAESVEIKRKLRITSVVVAGVLFLIFMFFWPIPTQWFVFIVPAVILVTFLNIKAARFCKACGKAASKNPFVKVKFCSNCGAEYNS
jgi:hypothetical protein